MAGALVELDACAFGRDELNEAGELLDPDGVAYVYRSPGEYFPDEFDLYSPRTGPAGESEIVLCELDLR